MPDKQDECGCHRECVTIEHICDKPCQWPNCLTDEEHAQLMQEIADDLF